MLIDLNCDVGEGCGNDAELMNYISSANVACGYHAGDRDEMLRTVELALSHDVAIGAHPGYADRENFGRFPVDLTEEQIYELIREQIGALEDVARSCGAVLSHVKPHGALYNRSAVDHTVAAAISRAVLDHDPTLVLFGLAGSVSIAAANEAGLRTASEGFADRTYQADLTLTPRSEPGALITDDELAVEQALRLATGEPFRSKDGTEIALRVDTICLHGDGQKAVSFAKMIRRSLESAGLVVRALQ